MRLPHSRIPQVPYWRLSPGPSETIRTGLAHRSPTHRNQSVEFVEVGLETGKNYRRFTGAEVAPATVESTTQTARMKFTLGLSPVRLP